MIHLILCGCGGRMGQAILCAAKDNREVGIVAGVDVNADALASTSPFPVYQSIDEIPVRAQVIVDFSHHSALPSLLDYALRTKTPLVVATTGHTEEEKKMMRDASKQVAVFSSGNMSIGVNLLLELCRVAAKTLGGDFDVEIVEKHHNQKLDAPSGTALMLADGIAAEREETSYVYDRHTVRQRRAPEEIGIHSIRGGTIVGEHQVIFAGNNEVISLSHSAASREIFAVGALRAAVYLADKGPGLYSMSDLINGK